MSEPPIVLHPKPWPAIALLFLCILFVAAGVWMASSGKWMGFVAVAFFGLGIPVAIIQLIPGSASLRIESSGITYSVLFRATSLPWSIVQEFFVVTMRQNGFKVREMVGFNFVSNYDRGRGARALSRAIGACEGALPDNYGMQAVELARLLNARLELAKGS